MRYGSYIVLALLLVSLPPLASADIVEWKDTAGVTHYTNLKGEVPSEEVARVVVDEQIWVPNASPAPDVTADPVPPPAPPRETIAPDTAREEEFRAFLAGLDSVLARGASTGGGGVYINGPLAVAVAPPPPYGGYVLPQQDWLLPGYSPFLTTAVVGRHREPIRDRLNNGFHGQAPFFGRFTSAAGPPPIGAAGPPPVGAAGRSSVDFSGGRFR